MSAASTLVTVRPIGTVRAPRTEALDDNWGSVRSVVELDAGQFTPDVVAGLHAFSHVEVVYFFHKVPESKIESGARHPRNNTDWPRVGIFAQRAKARPNRIGLSSCRLIQVDGLRLLVEGLDAIDGTPVIDIKPYLREFAPRGEQHQPAWSTEIMSKYFD